MHRADCLRPSADVAHDQTAGRMAETFKALRWQRRRAASGRNRCAETLSLPTAARTQGLLRTLHQKAHWSLAAERRWRGPERRSRVQGPSAPSVAALGEEIFLGAWSAAPRSAAGRADHRTFEAHPRGLQALAQAILGGRHGGAPRADGTNTDDRGKGTSPRLRNRLSPRSSVE
jgi:hypothetical protein